jgi:2-keto-4-pentenoate hydratase/2-oxohepta-3-ene-1,7-dioic acid hydratase in catechol pathway
MHALAPTVGDADLVRVGRIVHGEREVAVEHDGGTLHLLDGDIFDGTRTGETLDPADAAIASPCRPTKVLVLSRGWNPIEGWTAAAAADAAGVTEGHAARWLEGTELPGETPFVNPKMTSEVTGDGAEIRVPPFMSLDVWVEPELAIVIGQETYRASVDVARDAIFGYTVFNDVTAREFLQEPKDYFRAKCNETFASMGPWINTALSEDDVMAGLDVECRVNGEVRVRSNTRSLRFAPGVVVSAVSMHTTLRRGDVIALGCPPPPPRASPGDSVELEIESIGTLHNTVVREALLA